MYKILYVFDLFQFLFWGVRDIKSKLFAVKRPYVEAEIGYGLSLVRHAGRRDKVDKIRSRPCNNAKNNPNFPLEAFAVDVVGFLCIQVFSLFLQKEKYLYVQNL